MIPFVLSPGSFNDWLVSLESNPAAEQTRQVLLAIQAINQETKLPKQQKSVLLEHIYQSMMTFLAPLSTAILNSPIPLAQEEDINLQHIVTIYSELANGFASSIRKVSDLESAHTLFYGLQSLICAYLHISQVYQHVYPNFWKQSYLFYGLASRLEIKDLNIEQHDVHSNTISKAFKHLLALYHCDLEQFRPRAMLTVSDCIEKHTPQMHLGKKFAVEKASRYSGFDLNTDTPPSDLTQLKETETSAIRFFSAYSAATQINKSAANEAPGTGVIKSINREHLLQAAKTLSLSQKRKFTRFKEQSVRSGIIGFSHILEELHKTSPLEPNPKNEKLVDQIDPRVAGGWAVPNIELVTEGYESLDAMNRRHHQDGFLREEQNRANRASIKALRKNIWDKKDTKPQNETPVKPEKFHMTDYSIKGCGIIFDTSTSQTKVHVGDIIAINNSKTMETGIICRLSQLSEQKLQLGIKLLALESEIAYISLPNHDSIYTWAIFLPGIKELFTSDSLIFNDSKFQCGEFVNLHRYGMEPAPYRLNKLLHINFAATHVELFNSRGME